MIERCTERKPRGCAGSRRDWRGKKLQGKMRKDKRMNGSKNSGRIRNAETENAKVSDRLKKNLRTDLKRCGFVGNARIMDMAVMGDFSLR